ncbi:response regulator [Desulfosporosinus sp. SYSU MS00001]|uniref:response regulator n=1 Tax=Desulfosporosinus sp. SYSU MS00001 TaxID=3416284 RepID=UPI003CEE6C31
MALDNVKSKMLKILIVDDHTLFAEGTVSLLSSETNLEIVGIANNGVQCLNLLKSTAPDVILLDISLPDCSGINLIDDIKSIHPEVKIIMLTGLNPEGYLTKSLQKGVQGFLLKECNKTEMIEAIHYVVQGKEYFSKGLAHFLKVELVDNNDDQLITLKSNETEESLSPREREILELVSKGLNSEEVSLALGITKRTVNFHIGNILSKLGVKSRLKAVAIWKTMSNRD